MSAILSELTGIASVLATSKGLAIGLASLLGLGCALMGSALSLRGPATTGLDLARKIAAMPGLPAGAHADVKRILAAALLACGEIAS